jgi:hypothetical protein
MEERNGCLNSGVHSKCTLHSDQIVEIRISCSLHKPDQL